MALSDVLTTPETPRQRRDWHFCHRQDHELVRGVIQTKTKVNLPLLIMDPVGDNPEQVKNWLNDHQQMHDEANGLLGLPSNDLTTVNFEDPLQRNAWFWYNWQNHYQWHQKLGI